MRLTFVSDTHENFQKVRKIESDILFHCGDISYFGRGRGPRAFGEQMAEYPARLKVLIAGNHDMDFLINEPLTIAELYEGFNQPGKIGDLVYLRDSGINAEDFDLSPLKIWGSPWQPWFHDWAFNFPKEPEYYEKLAVRVYQDVPDDTDILITHGPPKGILDTYGKSHVGCQYLLNRVMEVKPKVHAFGHVHVAHGFIRKKETLYLNCAIVHGGTYRVAHEPYVVDYKDGKARVLTV